MNYEDVDKLRVSIVPSQDLVDSIKEKGVLTPILIRLSDRRIVDGKRRVAACKILGIKSIPFHGCEPSNAQITESERLSSNHRSMADPATYQRQLLKMCELHPDMTLKELAERLGNK